MRKIGIIMIAFIICTVGFPTGSFAATNNDSDDQTEKQSDTTNDKKDSKQDDEYNELGVKKGAKVHGEDISKLTKDELQYIPEGWRNGIDEGEDEHVNHGEAEENKLSTFKKANYPNVNDYIQSKNLPTAKVAYDHKSVFPKFGYRNGKPEGVVAHETANNSSTIDNEISYTTRNYQNAFVHAFVDNSQVIEIHPTNYASWGAGRFANERFIHVELVRVHSFDKFARSINNYANYIASLLWKYDLGVSSAEKTGTGSLWSHKAVSNHLGGTTHVDPHAYFQQWGYNWDEFVDLVQLKYDELAVTKK